MRMNYLIYENDDFCLWFCGMTQEFYKDKKMLSFQEFIRTIDTLPEKSPEWKHDIIQCWSEHIGLQVA